MNEGMNVELAKKAMSKATIEIEEVIRNYEKTHEVVRSNFSKSNDGAIGGTLGEEVMNSFDKSNNINFTELRSKIDNFINVRVAEIIKENQSMIDMVESVYR